MVQEAAGRLGGSVADPGPRLDGTAGRSGSEYSSMIRSASSQAATVSTARTWMLRNGLRHTLPSPACAAASRATSGSWS